MPNHGYNPVFVTFDVEYITVIAYIVRFRVNGFQFRKIFPLGVFNRRNMHPEHIYFYAAFNPSVGHFVQLRASNCNENSLLKMEAYISMQSMSLSGDSNWVTSQVSAILSRISFRQISIGTTMAPVSGYLPVAGEHKAILHFEIDSAAFQHLQRVPLTFRDMDAVGFLLWIEIERIRQFFPIVVKQHTNRSSQHDVCFGSLPMTVNGQYGTRLKGVEQSLPFGLRRIVQVVVHAETVARLRPFHYLVQ